MSDKIVPSPPEPEKPAKIGDTEIFSGAFELVVNRHHHLHDMTPVAAEAHKEITRLQYAVPAEEATKQAQEVTAQALQVTAQALQVTAQAKETTAIAVEETKKHWIQYGVSGFCVLAGFGALLVNPTAGASIVGIIAVLGASQFGSKWLDKKKKNDG